MGSRFSYLNGTKNRNDYAKHHPFTSPKPEDIPLLDTNPQDVRANAYDFVVNEVKLVVGQFVYIIQNYKQNVFALDSLRTSTGSIWLFDGSIYIWSTSAWWIGIWF